MLPKSTKAILLTLGLVLTISMGASAGVTVFEKGDSNLKLGGLLQAWGVLTEDGNAQGDGLGTDFYLRRMRLMAYGQLGKKVNFFIETDNPNFGKNGDFSQNMFIQDAYMELNLHKAFQLDIGMLLTPFSHQGMQGATSLLGLDYHSNLIRYAPGTNKVWRDFGLMFRGLLFGDRLEYRLAVLNGVHGDASTSNITNDDGDVVYANFVADPRNHNDIPQITARLTYNIFEPEGGGGVGGMYYDGIYLKKTDAGIVSTKKVLSVGASFDWQDDMNVIFKDPTDTSEDRILERSDYIAAAADIFADIPLDASKLMSLTGQVNYYYYNHGDRENPLHYYNMTGDKKAFSGMGIASEVGFRYDAYQPLILIDWYQSKGDAASKDMGDYLSVMGGFNYFMMGHSASFKLQAGSAKANGGEWGFSGTLQAQLLF